jgi:hypothetical protein
VEDRHAVAVQVDAVEHQAMQMNIQIGRRAEALNERDRAGVGSVLLNQNSSETVTPA